MCLGSVQHVVLLWLFQYCSSDSTGPIRTIKRIFGGTFKELKLQRCINATSLSQSNTASKKASGVMRVCKSVCSWVCIRVHALAPMGGCSRVLNYTYSLIPLIVATMKGFPAFPLLKWRDVANRLIRYISLKHAREQQDNVKPKIPAFQTVLFILRGRGVPASRPSEKNHEAWTRTALPSLSRT